MARLSLIIIAIFFSFQAYGAECGLFRVVKGKVTYQKKNSSKLRKAKVNKKVCAGDKIKTELASRTKIVMADGNEINVSPSTELFIEQYERNVSKNEKKVLINVLYGKIRSNVKDKYKDTKNNHYRVKTKSAVAGFRGTEFMASFNQTTNQSRILTFEGRVAVGQFKSGNFVAEVTVKPGNTLPILPAHPFTHQNKFHHKNMLNWIKKPILVAALATVEILPTTQLVIPHKKMIKRTMIIRKISLKKTNPKEGNLKRINLRTMTAKPMEMVQMPTATKLQDKVLTAAPMTMAQIN